MTKTKGQANAKTVATRTRTARSNQADRKLQNVSSVPKRAAPVRKRTGSKPNGSAHKPSPRRVKPVTPTVSQEPRANGGTPANTGVAFAERNVSTGNYKVRPVGQRGSSGIEGSAMLMAVLFGIVVGFIIGLVVFG
jgi:hypothetical protein